MYLTGEVSGVKAKVEFAYDQVKDEEGRVTEDVTFQVQYLDAGVKARRLQPLERVKS